MLLRDGEVDLAAMEVAAEVAPVVEVEVAATAATEATAEGILHPTFSFLNREASQLPNRAASTIATSGGRS